MHPQKYGRVVLAAALFLSFLALPILAQMRHTAAASDLNRHIFLITPVVGIGSPSDPKRPMFVPAEGFKPGTATSANGVVNRTGIVGYHAQISDDGKFALVEFVAATQADFKDILSTTDSRVQIFQKGIQGKDQIEAAFKVYSKDFSFDKFEMVGVH